MRGWHYIASDILTNTNDDDPWTILDPWIAWVEQLDLTWFALWT